MLHVIFDALSRVRMEKQLDDAKKEIKRLKKENKRLAEELYDAEKFRYFVFEKLNEYNEKGD